MSGGASLSKYSWPLSGEFEDDNVGRFKKIAPTKRCAPTSRYFLFLPVNCSFISIYSNLSAVMGSNLAAFLAGYQPKNTPVITQTAKARIIESAVTKVGHLM